MTFCDRIINVEQGSDAWKAARAGRVTASRIKDILATVKTGEAASRRNYRMQLATEILTGRPQEQTFRSKEMDWGNEQEPYARAAYQLAEGVLVDQIGMILHPRSGRCAASPDGLVGWDGINPPKKIVQFKCPNSTTHIDYIEARVVPTDYQPQMIWEKICAEAEECDFVSFDPRFTGEGEGLQLFIIPFMPADSEIQRIEREVDRFLEEVDATVARLRRLGKEAA